MGDVILTSPIVRCVKNQLNAEIHFLIKPVFSELVDHNPAISKVIQIDSKNSSHIQILKDEHYDLILDLQKNRKSIRLTKRLKLKSYTFNKTNVRKWLLVQSGLDLMSRNHLVDRYFDGLKELGIENDLLGLEVHNKISLIEEQELAVLPNEYFVLAVGAQHKGKSLSLSQILSILASTHHPCVLVGGKQEVDLGKEVLKKHNTNCIIYNFIGKSSISGTAEIVKRSKAVISGDTGIMHMAAGFKIPQISIWGCTTPNLGMYPYLPSKHSLMVEPKNLSNRPCSKLGDKCKNTPNWCIQHIDMTEVINHLMVIMTL